MSDVSGARWVRAVLSGLLATALIACEQSPSNSAAGSTGLIEGHPAGPYRMRLQLAPPHPAPAEETRLTWQLSHAANGRPLENLQVLHERVIHNFIVNLDFSSFAHIHHEDFRALTTADLANATFTLPYQFPRAGHYRIVSDFTHRDRSWTKHFDVTVGTASSAATPVADFSRMREVEDITGVLSVSPSVPLAGYESELVLTLHRQGLPVTDLGLILGSEVHVALWREDGQYFGHTHSYTPHMASMLRAMHDKGADAASRARMLADMMVMMMNMPSELVFKGPQIPVHYVFPEAGVYHLFLQCAPGGEPRVFHFALQVHAYQAGMETRIESIVSVDDAHQ